MVQQRPQRSCSAVVIGLVVALASTFLACTFGSPPPDPNTPTELLKMSEAGPHHPPLGRGPLDGL